MCFMLTIVKIVVYHSESILLEINKVIVRVSLRPKELRQQTDFYIVFYDESKKEKMSIKAEGKRGLCMQVRFTKSQSYIMIYT